MPTGKRREQRADRPQILEATRKIARRDDWQTVTIRRIADELGYTSPLIYEHFQNKQDVLMAIIGEGFRDLALALKQAPRDPKEPEGSLLAIAEAYWVFAQGQPEVYKIMHGMGGVPLEQAEVAQGAQEVCELAMAALQDWAKVRNVQFDDPYEATEILWATLHGITCLGLADRLGPQEERPLRLAKHALTTMLNGWRNTKKTH